MEELQEACPTKYEAKEIKDCELLVLAELHFALKSLTVFDFVTVFSGYCSGEVADPDEALTEILDTSYSGSPRRTITLDYTMHRYRHSFVAAACILCYRKQMDAAPLWPESLATVTGYTIEAVETVALCIMKYADSIPKRGCRMRRVKTGEEEVPAGRVLGHNANLVNLPVANVVAIAKEEKTVGRGSRENVAATHGGNKKTSGVCSSNRILHAV